MTITVIVDDADPQIQYSAGWSLANPSALGSEYIGINKSVGDTLHNASVFLTSEFPLQSNELDLSFTYSFNGTAINMYTVMSPFMAERVAELTNWSCVIDGIGVPPIALQKVGEANTYQICAASGLTETTEHMLQFTLSAYFPAPGSNINPTTTTMLFDYLEYTPLISSVDRMFDYVSVSYDDPGIVYNGGWALVGGLNEPAGFFSKSPGCSAEYNFTGTSVSWIGIINGASGVSISQFSADGEAPISMQMPIAGPNTTEVVPNALFFQSRPLNISTTHTIKGTFANYPNPEARGPALVLQSLIIQNGTIAAVSPPNVSISPSPTATHGPSATNIHRSSDPTKVLMIGAVLGSIVSVIISGIALYVWRRRKRHKAQKGAIRIAAPFAADQQLVTSRNIAYYQNLLLPSAKALFGRQRLHRYLSPTPEKLTRAARESRSVQDRRLGGTPEGRSLQEQGPRANQQPNTSRATNVPVREHDSGLRSVEDLGIEESMGNVLPPAYTAD